MEPIQVIKGDLFKRVHRKAFFELLRLSIPSEYEGKEKQKWEIKERALLEGIRGLNGTEIYFAEKETKIIGMAVCFVGFSLFYGKKNITIHNLFVLPEYRKQGVGKKLLNAIEAKARKRHFCEIVAEVRKDNLAARKLYESVGIKENPRPKESWSKIL